jgi:hypothetical protein
MNQYDDYKPIIAASKVLTAALRLRDSINNNSDALTWCEVSEAHGRYDLNTLINNLYSVCLHDGDNDIPIVKLLR